MRSFLDVDVANIIKVLKDVVRWILEHIAARMIVDMFQKHLKRDAFMQVFTGMDFLTNIDALVVGVIQNGAPAFGQLIKRCLNQTGGAL